MLRRKQLDVSLAHPVLDRIETVGVNDGVLQSAAAIETHVKSLDAIHLATCLLLGANLTFVTHDVAMGLAAETLGFVTFDPLHDEQQHP